LKSEADANPDDDDSLMISTICQARPAEVTSFQVSRSRPPVE
jgi:hypothetical protein